MFSTDSAISSKQGALLLEHAHSGNMEGFVDCIQRGASLDIRTQDAKRESAAHVAIRARHGEIVKMLLRNKGSIDSTDSTGRTPLHVAVLLQYVDMVTLLVEINANVAIQDNNGDTALHFACRQPDANIVSVLLNYTTEFDIRNKSGRTPLMVAVHSHMANNVRLVAARANCSTTDDQGSGPLHCGAFTGDAAVCQALVDAGASLMMRDRHNNTPLHIAAKRQPASLMSILLESVISEVKLREAMAARDAVGDSPLHIAVRRGAFDVAKLLVAAGAELEARNNEGATPVLVAARAKQLKTLQALVVQLGADPMSRDNAGRTARDWLPEIDQWVAEMQEEMAEMRKIRAYHHKRLSVVTNLLSASCSSQLQSAQAALEQGAEIDAVDEHGRSSLFWAVLRQDTDLVSLLCQNSARHDLVDSNGDSPLTLALTQKNIRTSSFILNCLLEHGIGDVNQANGAGKTPLLLATEALLPDVVRLLLAKGASHICRDEQGRTPLLVALSRNSTPLTQQLIAGGAQVNVSASGSNQSPLHLCCANDNVTLVSVLLSHGAIVNAVDDEQVTPLMIAVQKELPNIVEILIANGANVNMQDRQGASALHYAFQRRTVAVIIQLLEAGADVTLLDSAGNSAFHVAVDSRQGEGLAYALAPVIELRAEKSVATQPVTARLRSHAYMRMVSAVLDTRNLLGDTPLLASVKAKLLKISQLLLDAGSSPSIVALDGTTMWEIAAKSQSAPLLEILNGYRYVSRASSVAVKAVAPPPDLSSMIGLGAEQSNAPTLFYESAPGLATQDVATCQLFSAVSENNPDQVTAAIRQGASVNAADEHQQTALHTACQRGSIKCSRILLEHGANANVVDCNGDTPLLLATLNRHAELHRMLLSCGANAKVQNKLGRTALHNVSERNDVPGLQLILQHQDVGCLDFEGNSPLHYAASAGACDSIRILLKQGAEIDVVNLKHRTPLHEACLHNQRVAATALLRAGASNSIADENKCHPSDYLPASDPTIRI
eukprot:TRINITY_DN9632_c0_g1_i1.p1 TRINITY_DN9632_c0_g1~~TRINITY_DN9632_c0_g1_i1.p1  ORF type:complete len:1005 (-),score=178.88 TRINITY_DN9632_c0_g1_i1:44-3058(-)